MASSVDQKMLKSMKFPAEFSQKVDMQKINVEVIKKWAAGKLQEMLGFEDDVVTELCFSLLEGARFPSIKDMQIQLTGFLEKSAPVFCKELWTLCLSAQSNPQGVPKELLEAKKLELIQEKVRRMESTCYSIQLTLKYRSKLRRLPRLHASGEKQSERKSARQTRRDNVSEAVEDETEAGADVVGGTSIDDR